MIRFLVAIDLSSADGAAFDAYEAAVLPLLANHGGRLEMRVRAQDGGSETHLVAFADQAGFDADAADPARLAKREEWERCGARSVVTEVSPVED